MAHRTWSFTHVGDLRCGRGPSMLPRQTIWPGGCRTSTLTALASQLGSPTCGRTRSGPRSFAGRSRCWVDLVSGSPASGYRRRGERTAASVPPTGLQLRRERLFGFVDPEWAPEYEAVAEISLLASEHQEQTRANVRGCRRRGSGDVLVEQDERPRPGAVSYTHLTLPTIY